MAGVPTAVPILIVGGGIGGLAAALAIAQSGREVTLLERAPQFAEIGAGLQLGPNATRVLDRLKLLDRALELAVLPEHGVMLDAITGEKLTVLDLGAAFRARYGYPYVVLHRSDLLAILLDACRGQPNIALENNKAVASVWSTAQSAGLQCADGSEYRCELLIGADGLHSRVRTLIDDSAPQNSGYVAYRGTLPMSEVKAEVSADDVVLWIGPGLHLMQYPIRRREVYNQVAVFRSDQFLRDEDPYGSVEELRARFSVTCDEVRRMYPGSRPAGTGQFTTGIRCRPGSPGAPRCWATPHIRCFSTSARVPVRPSKTPTSSAVSCSAARTTSPPRSPASKSAASPARPAVS